MHRRRVKCCRCWGWMKSNEAERQTETTAQSLSRQAGRLLKAFDANRQRAVVITTSVKLITIAPSISAQVSLRQNAGGDAGGLPADDVKDRVQRQNGEVVERVLVDLMRKARRFDLRTIAGLWIKP